MDSGSRYGHLVFLFDNRRHTTRSLFERMTTLDNDLTRNFMLEINLDVLRRNTHTDDKLPIKGMAEREKIEKNVGFFPYKIDLNECLWKRLK